MPKRAKEPRFRLYFYDGWWKSRQYNDSHHGFSKHRTHEDALTAARQWMGRYAPQQNTSEKSGVSITETDSHGYVTNHEAWEGRDGKWVKTNDAHVRPKLERATKASLRKAAKAGVAGPAKVKISYRKPVQIGKRIV